MGMAVGRGYKFPLLRGGKLFGKSTRARLVGKAHRSRRDRPKTVQFREEGTHALVDGFLFLLELSRGGG